MPKVESKLPVVSVPDAKDEAYSMGAETFTEDVNRDGLELFKESASYINNTSKKLKSLAGANADTKHCIAVDCPEDIPAEGKVVPVTWVHEELIEAYDAGALGLDIE